MQINVVKAVEDKKIIAQAAYAAKAMKCARDRAAASSSSKVSNILTLVVFH